ncbi:MAG: signal peptidase I [Wenzhouxiangellaceae bacterium]
MNIDFALILTVLTLITGLIWLIDHFLWAPKRRERLAHGDESAARMPLLIETSRSFFPVLLLVLLFRSFLFEPFRIPSGSMIPTLLDGDFIVVNKYAYGLRLPVLNNKIMDVADPQRGDVMVFRYPRDPSQNYIKRVIGLPGDRITYRNKHLYINGEQMEQEPLGTFSGKGDTAFIGELPPQRRLEHLGEVSHEILVQGEVPSRGERSWVVPEGHYFGMGDNRDSSADSRSWGFIPEANIVGKAVGIWLHVKCERGFDCFDFSRIGQGIE